MEWYQAVEKVAPHVVRITTPQGSGTGFLLFRSADGTIAGVATAAHVVNHAHYWEQPIRLHLAATGETILLRQSDRAILLDETRDTAAILFNVGDAALPAEPFGLVASGYHLRIGNAIGWLGYPALAGSQLCFFTGTISAWVEPNSAYFVDGVAINGVSGGPAFISFGEQLEIVGVVSAYMPNRATGETLPGLGIVRGVEHFHEVLNNVKSLEEAKAQESPLSETPPPPAPTEEPSVQAASRRVT